MQKFRIRKDREKLMFWNKIRIYIDFSILICCLVMAFNIYSQYYYPTEPSKDIVYIFHDYEWNEYILNKIYHGSADDFSFLADTTTPETIKSDSYLHWAGSASLADIVDNSTDDGAINDNNIYHSSSVNDDDKTVKDNQISFEQVMDDLWFNTNHDNLENGEKLIISLWKSWYDDDETIYDIYQTTGKYDSSLIIEKRNNSETKQKTYDIMKIFSFVYEWRVLPTLADRNEIFHQDGFISTIWFYDSDNTKSRWITIIDSYKDCPTPWWYKIMHWDSVLAYQQMSNAPDICNIERRFCRDGKLSWTYTQQWCSVNKWYTFSQRWNAEVLEKKEEAKSPTTQNEDWSVTVNDKEIWSSFVFDKPNNTYTEFYSWNNVIVDQEIEQTKRPKWWCTTPWGEKVPHWQLVQAFRHENWFSDAPCEAQLRICTMWELVWTFTQPTCKTWDTSFIDWINWSPTRENYSREKLNRIKKQIKSEESYDKNYGRFTNSDALDNILKILDS